MADFNRARLLNKEPRLFCEAQNETQPRIDMGIFKKEDEQAKKAREEEEQRRRTAVLTMSTEQLRREVLPSFPADQSSAGLSLSFHRGTIVLPD